MRPRPLVVIIASILVVGSASLVYSNGGVGHLLGWDRPPLGVEPIAIGGAWDCPSGHAVRAYDSGRLYYPGYYPLPLPYEIRPARCFKTGSEAATKGFRLAPPPPGSIVFDGVYLVPVQPQVHDECAKAATAVGLSFPCPTLVPAVEANQICSGSSACLSGNKSIQYALEFTTPPDFPGALVNPKGLGSNDGASGTVLIFVNAGDAALSAGPGPADCAASGTGPVVMNVLSDWQTCNSHRATTTLSLTWQRASTAYQVVSREQSSAARKLVELVASKLVAVPPQVSRP